MIARSLVAATFAALAIVYYWGLGPPPTPSELVGLPWWRPRGFAVRWLGDGARPAAVVLAFVAPLIAVLAFRLFRGALSRALLLGVGLALAALAIFGVLFPIGWRTFPVRFPLALVATALFTSAALLVPSLLGAGLRRPPIERALWVVGAVLGIYVLSTETTGWNPALPLNLSPWPIITMFGFLLIGYAVASLHVASGIGAALGARPGRGGRVAGAAAAGVAGAGLSTALVSEPSVGLAIAMAVASAVYALVLLLRPVGANGVVRLASGALLAATIFLANWSATRYHAIARNQTAERVVEALEGYRALNDDYPERLEDLVPDHLSEVPVPQIGLLAQLDERFSYSSYGMSYTLEFPSILWMQCSYSPPFVDLDEDEEEAYDVAARDESDPEADLAGSWSCDSAPPPLW